MTATIITFEASRAFRRQRLRDTLRNIIQQTERHRDSRLIREHDRMRTALAEITAMPSELELWGDDLRKQYQRMQEIAHEAIFGPRQEQA
jgi:hypothetical protein